MLCENKNEQVIPIGGRNCNFLAPFYEFMTDRPTDQQTDRPTNQQTDSSNKEWTYWVCEWMSGDQPDILWSTLREDEKERLGG